MIILEGTSASEGLAFGTLCFDTREDETPMFDIYLIDNTDIPKEVERFEEATKSAVGYFRKLAENFESVAHNAIFEAHMFMIKDRDYQDSVVSIISRKKVNAETAVWDTAKIFEKKFEQMSDPYLRSRSQDVLDISICIINFLQNKTKAHKVVGQELVLCAEDFIPSQISQIKQRGVRAFISKYGSYYSHSAILLRTMNVPMIVNIGDDLHPYMHGKDAIVDGYEGKVYVEPDESTIQELSQRNENYKKLNADLLKLVHVPCITEDEKRIRLCANMNTFNELKSISKAGADGIGLLRSEFIYLDRDSYPSEDEQLEIYKEVLETMGDKEVVIRTLDIGSDKTASYMNLEQEENPALGRRGIRFCLKNPEIFRTQLRALYRASVYGNLSIMFPMITSAKEIREIKKHIGLVCQDLADKNIDFNENMKLGIMIETPIAAIMSDKLAPEVDFFSIGTNDLSQYTIAVDRQSPVMNDICNASTQHAVMRLIKNVTESAYKNNIPVKICGDMAFNEELVPLFVTMGVNELSVPPAKVCKTKKIITGMNTKNFKDHVRFL